MGRPRRELAAGEFFTGRPRPDGTARLHTLFSCSGGMSATEPVRRETPTTEELIELLATADTSRLCQCARRRAVRIVEATTRISR